MARYPRITTFKSNPQSIYLLIHFLSLFTYSRYLDTLTQPSFNIGLNGGFYKQWQGQTTTPGATFPTPF